MQLYPRTTFLFTSCVHCLRVQCCYNKLAVHLGVLLSIACFKLVKHLELHYHSFILLVFYCMHLGAGLRSRRRKESEVFGWGWIPKITWSRIRIFNPTREVSPIE